MTTTIISPDSPTTTTSSPGGGSSGSVVPTHWSELRVGDCMLSGLADIVENVAVVDCSDAHSAEIISFFDVSMTEFNWDEISTVAEAGCKEDFADYVGISYERSALSLTWLQPTESTWADGDREIMCVLEHRSVSTSSARNSRQ